MATLHQLNILCHVVFGTLALLVGLGPLLAAKGGARHRQWGRWFLGLAAVVLGLVVFNFRPFLSVIVLLSVYQAYSGYRALRLQASGPTGLDTGLALGFLLAGIVFLLALPRIRLVWSPVVMYSTLGALLATTSYDASRPLWRARWRRGAGLYEHIWKMTSTYAALLSAFSGTVLAAYQPYSQFVPSVLGTAVGLSFLAYTYRRRHALPAAAATEGAAAASLLAAMNDRRLLLFGIPLLAWLELVPRGLFRLPSLSYLLVAYAFSLAFTLVIWLGVRQWWAGLLRRWPQPASTARRLGWLAAGSVAYTLLATVVLGEGIALLYGGHLAPAQALRETGLNLVSSLIVLLVYESTHSFRQWEANLRRADQLAQTQTQAQLDALAQQLDPHFLFNSLNTLAALIDPADADAQHYVEGLADVYRYVLLSRERPTVPLAEELAFVQTYVALQQVRFRDNVQVSYDLAPAALARGVAPLSVQTLIENALKHNEASQARPLHVRLRATPDALTVENTYQPRPAGLASGLGTGLASVRRRYALLGAAQPVAITQTGDTFTVVLPLLPAP